MMKLPPPLKDDGIKSFHPIFCHPTCGHLHFCIQFLDAMGIIVVKKSFEMAP
jgi:hypothetical protein